MSKKIFASVIILLIVIMMTYEPPEQAVQEAIAGTKRVWTRVPSQTPYPTYTEVVVTKIIMVTATHTATPAYTATATMEALLQSRTDGYYLVNVDIAPGNWRSTGTSDNCYWSVTGKAGNFIKNHFGQAGGLAYIAPNAFQVQFSNCGTWEFVSPP